MMKSVIFILCLALFPFYIFGQKNKYALSENGKYFAYCTKVSKKDLDSTSNHSSIKNLYEFRYYNIDAKELIFSHQFYHFNKSPIDVDLSHNGNIIVLKANRKTIVINAVSKSIVTELEGNQYISFPRHDDFFLRYTYNPKSRTNILNAYDVFTGAFLRSYKSSKYSKGYGDVWVSDDDMFILQQRSHNKFNIWRTDNKIRIKSVTSNSFKMDYYNNKVTFFKGSKSYTYSLKGLKQISSIDLRIVKRNFIKEKKAKNNKCQIKFLDEITSNSGDFIIIPFIENKVQSLLLSSTQRSQSVEISINDLELINNIKWLNDSILMLNHQNNTITLLNLLNFDDRKHIDLGLSKKRYIQNRDHKMSPDFKFHTRSKKGMLFNNLIIEESSLMNNSHKLENHDFINYTLDNKYLLVKKNKTNEFGVVNLNNLYEDQLFDVQYFTDTIPVVNELEIVEDAEIPLDYKPYKITDFKHISELKDTSDLINLVLKNIEFSDSIISLNTHLIDDQGVYYYGASDQKWKHIWCNLILKYKNDPAHQITDFEIIEHKENIQIPNTTSIVMDHSGSMGNHRAKKLQLAVEDLIKIKSNEDEMSLIKFDDKIGLESYPEKNKEKLLRNLKKDGLGEYGGGTSILDAANTSISVLKNTQGVIKKSVFILTDGQENCSFVDHNVVVQRAIDNNINIYTIGYGKNVDKNYLRSISSPTDGAYYQIYRSKDFEWIFNDINSKIRNYYEIRFKSNKVGAHKAILKVCFNNNQSDTLAIDFNNKALDITYYDDNDANYISYNQSNSSDDSDIIKEIPDIKDFSYIRSSLDNSFFDTKVKIVDSIKMVIQTEFENINFPNIVFKFDKTEIVPSSLDGIEEVYDFLVKHPDIMIEISGHTDHTGKDAYNLSLSEKRADRVKSLLIDMGISEFRISTIGYGEDDPVVSNSNEINKQKNRRVDFRIVNY